MFDKIKKYTKQPSFQTLNDSRTLGLVAFGIVAVLVSWSGVKSIQTNYELQKQISKLEQQNQVMKLENENKKLENQYYQTDEFLELAARRQFGKAVPGETVYLVPKKVALAHTVELAPSNKTESKERETHQPTYQKNFEAWIDFFLHRRD
jgi:cell division protein FtsB